MQTVSSSKHRDRATDISIALGLILLATVMVLAALLRRHDASSGAEFIFSDAGTNLLLAERLSEGAKLYRDIGYSYGPLAIQPYRVWAELFGNTPRSFSAMLGLVSVVNILLAYVVLRMRMSRLTSVVVVATGLLSTMLIPGSIVSGGQASAYFVFERTFFLVMLAVWIPHDERTMMRALALGMTLGLWQWLRFGTALFVGLSIAILDVVALVLRRARSAEVRRWFLVSLVTLASFLVVQGAWVAYAFATLPRPDAVDALWPSYVLGAFELWPKELRRPHFIGLPNFIAQQLPIVVGTLFGSIGTGLLLHRIRTTQSSDAALPDRQRPVHDLRFVLPILFYAIGCISLFRSVYHFFQYAWLLPLSAALLINRRERLLGSAFALLMLPTLLLNARISLINRPPPDAVRLDAPNGSRMTVSPEVAARVRVVRAYASESGGRALFFLPTGGGFHAMFDVAQPTRQVWHTLGFFRGSDEEEMYRMLDTKPSAVVLTEYPRDGVPGADPCTWYLWRPFEPAMCDRLARHLATSRAIRVDDATWILPGIADSAITSSGSGSARTAP